MTPLRDPNAWLKNLANSLELHRTQERDPNQAAFLDEQQVEWLLRILCNLQAKFQYRLHPTMFGATWGLTNLAVTPDYVAWV